MKYIVPRSYWGLGLRFTTLCVVAAVSFSAQAKELKFEQAFSEKGEPGAVHYQAEFVSKGANHQLEVWRDGEQRLKRRTDDTIETYAFRKRGDLEFHMSVLDLKKKINTQIDRTNLYRIGNFTDWFDLAHGLKHPAGEYQIAKSQAQDGDAKAIKDCQWYALVQNSHTTRICWSLQSRLPLVIQSQEGAVVWRVLALDQKPIAAKTFEIHDEGFVHNDANQDIERD